MIRGSAGAPADPSRNGSRVSQTPYAPPPFISRAKQESRLPVAWTSLGFAGWGVFTGKDREPSSLSGPRLPVRRRQGTGGGGTGGGRVKGEVRYRRRQDTGGGRVQEDEGLEAQRAADDLHSQRQERKMKICDGEKEAGL
ncbi:hypothetical protein C0Q70_19963 [Pomacea canaliculata]|uniref:Uncharacterized protein n=1 Tax=Pomacea canaliculata TaxID=400727 RepID=A0A2T7NE75_POMCA|nr:hypothetical protein C0Q70_19963 [Pomacea canaliculata]